ncbi:MAG: 23S rRNA (pseudouridine(1915)-N(3))-methyltransferase RlmH [Lachnospiraceae bacterium]|nr:23S rRNA (pseudouridine(1915)-N(3))-methyltransferase RlmH [Lachnospiraceae bacterium]
MKITIIAVGKIKEKFYRDALSEYDKRLSKYAKLKIIEVDDEKAPEHISDVLKEQILRKEGEKILRHITAGTYVVSLEIFGKSMDSEGFATHLSNLKVGGVSHIRFIIGGSLGLHPSVCERADMHLSFSAMTFPHQMMRVILLEQVYRAFRIEAGEPYHK